MLEEVIGCQETYNRLMCMGYSRDEIEAGFSLQARSNGDFTVESVRDAIWRWLRSWRKDCISTSRIVPEGAD